MTDKQQPITEEELQRLRQDLEACRREKDALAQKLHDQTFYLAKLGHDFRNPLSSVIGLSEMVSGMLEEQGNESLSNPVMRIQRAGLRLLTMIDNVCDLAKLEIHRTDPKPINCDLAPLIRNTVDILGDVIQKHGNTVRIDCPDTLPQITTDVNWLGKILHHLIGNAATFTEKGTITIAARLTGEKIIITITDDGPGIPKSLQDSLFKGFFVADGGAARKNKGTGLGLSICHEMLLDMEGTLQVISEEGQGTEIIITLPLSVS